MKVRIIKENNRMKVRIIKEYDKMKVRIIKKYKQMKLRTIKVKQKVTADNRKIRKEGGTHVVKKKSIWQSFKMESRMQGYKGNID